MKTNITKVGKMLIQCTVHGCATEFIIDLSDFNDGIQISNCQRVAVMITPRNKISVVIKLIVNKAKGLFTVNRSKRPDCDIITRTFSPLKKQLNKIKMTGKPGRRECSPDPLPPRQTKPKLIFIERRRIDVSTLTDSLGVIFRSSAGGFIKAGHFGVHFNVPGPDDIALTELV